jgi:hypothetical protein
MYKRMKNEYFVVSNLLKLIVKKILISIYLPVDYVINMTIIAKIGTQLILL